jgi:hypothetical protein
MEEIIGFASTCKKTNWNNVKKVWLMPFGEGSN